MFNNIRDIFEDYYRQFILAILFFGLILLEDIFNYFGLSYRINEKIIIYIGFIIILYIISKAYDEYTYKMNNLGNMIRWLEDYITRDRHRSNVQSTGISKVYDNQSKAFADSDTIIKNTVRSISILGTSLVSVLWNPAFEEHVINSLEKGVTFRILILNPESDVVKFLAIQEGRDIKSMEGEIQLAKLRWMNLIRKTREYGTIEMKLYDGLPSVTLLLSDDEVIFIPNLYSKTIYASPAFRGEKGLGMIYQTYKIHFEIIWDYSEELIFE